LYHTPSFIGDLILGKAAYDSPLRLTFLGRYNNQHATKLIYPSSKVHCVCLQDIHRMTPMTFVFQLCDPFVKRV
jgi:hypothetical protein